MASYAVVSFDEDHEVSVVPLSWLAKCENSCYWPPYREASKVTKAIKTLESPLSTWNKHSARVLKKCGDYAEARILAKMAENSSDLQSEGELGRGYRRMKRKRFDSDSDSGEVWNSGGTLSYKNLPSPPQNFDASPLKRYKSVTQKPSSLQGSRTTTPRPQAAKPDDHGGSCNSGSTRSLENSPSPSRNFDGSPLKRYNAFTRKPSSLHGSRTTSPRPQAAKPDGTECVLRSVARCEVAIEEVHEKVSEILNVLHVMKNDQRKTIKKEDFTTVQKYIPVKTYEEFLALSSKLGSDPDFENLMYRRLLRLGGTSVKASVKYIIDACLTNEMQTKFNWEGRHGWRSMTHQSKTGLKDTKLCSIMIDALLNNKNFSTTEAEVRKIIMNYLRNSLDRCGGRTKRAEARAQHSDSSTSSLNSPV